MNEKWEAARRKLFGKDATDRRKIEFAKKWLDENFDRLYAEGKEATALDALHRYEMLCDDYKINYGVKEHER